MAQILFESVSVPKVADPPAAENSTVLAVHRMLDNQIVAQPQIGSVLDENDVFQCGKCKKQFSSIDVFVNHKAECNSSITQISDISIPSNICGLPQNAVVLQKIEIPSSLSNYPQSLILSEADFLQLSAAGLESNVSNPPVTSDSSLRISSSHQILQQTPYGDQESHVQQVFQHVSSQDPQQPHAIELSFVNNKLISRPIILTSQEPDGSVQSLILNIGSSPQPQTIICSAPENDKNSSSIDTTPETPVTCNEGVPVNREKEPSTVNIITEFHSSMVKGKKSSEKEAEDSQNKKDHKLNCAYCWKTFTKNFDLQQHIRCHTGEKPFQCIVCGRAFAQKSNVKKHMQTHKVWPDGLTKTLPPLPSKNNSVSSEEASQDSNSGDGFSEQNEEENEKIKGGEFDKSSYICPYCKKIHKSYYKLKSHMKEHEREKVYKCILATCGLMFSDLDPFLEHVRSHENEMTYNCRECNKNFASLYDLGSHQYSHSLYPNSKSRSSKRYFQCCFCLNKYSTTAALDHHLATTTHSYSCTLCKKVFPCERYLRRHLQIHSKDGSFTCKHCGKGFKTENYLKVHMLVHSEEKPFKCSTCKAAFNRSDKLKRHLLIHEPVKRYKCPFRTHCGCSKEFSRPDKLKSHILTHSCVKPFNCKVCGRSFTRRTHLRDHVKHNHDKDSPMLDESENSDKNSSSKPQSENNNEKLHKCHKVSKKQNRLVSNRRIHKMKRSRTKLPVNENKKVKVSDMLSVINESSQDNVIDCAFDLSDDIPTAHIEIISAEGSLVSSSDLGHISLETDMNYEDLQFESAVPSESPISVEVIQSSNTDSLLDNELNSTSPIEDFS